MTAVDAARTLRPLPPCPYGSARARFAAVLTLALAGRRTRRSYLQRDRRRHVRRLPFEQPMHRVPTASWNGGRRALRRMAPVVNVLRGSVARIRSERQSHRNGRARERCRRTRLGEPVFDPPPSDAARANLPAGGRGSPGTGRRPGGFSERTFLYVPVDLAPFEREPRSPVFNHLVIGRLKPGVQTMQATAELNGLQRQLAKVALNGLRSADDGAGSLQAH